MGAIILPFPANRRASRESLEDLLRTLTFLLDLVDEVACKLSGQLNLEAGQQEYQHFRDRDMSEQDRSGSEERILARYLSVRALLHGL